MYKNAGENAKIYVDGNLIPNEDEKGLKTAGLFTSWELNDQYYTIDSDLCKKKK